MDFQWAHSHIVSLRSARRAECGDGYEMSSFTAAMTDCRPALASPNSICVLGSKYSSFSMPA